MALESIVELRTRIEEADFSVNNPKMQHIYELELEKWVTNYHEKKERRYYDIYGGPGDIPEEIEFMGGTYSPDEILQHVKDRDEVGMNVLMSMQQFRDRDYFGRVGEGLLSIIQADGIDEPDIIRGMEALSTRDLVEEALRYDPSSMIITVNMCEAIKNLYGQAEEPRFPAEVN